MPYRARSSRRPRSSQYPGPLAEPLEPRSLFSAVIRSPIPTPVDVSPLAGPQAEPSIAASLKDPRVLFAASNMNGSSLFAATSSDGGATWAGREFATGADGLPRACCDPSAAFDEFGNLFFAYLNSVDGRIELLLSVDNGLTFSRLGEFKEQGDQPTVVTGNGMVWIAWQQEDEGAIAYRARVTALGTVAKFGKPQRIVGGSGQNIADIAIGPTGQVTVAYQVPGPNPDGPDVIKTQVDVDGLGRKKFSKPATVGPVNVGNFDRIPAQVHRTIDSEIALAYDRSPGPYNGRLYMVFTDETPDESNNTDVFLRYSDSNGQSWSTPVRVNDDAGTNSQFFPRLAVDPTTGNVAVSWYDCRNDLGSPGLSSLDAIANNDVQVYAAIGSPAADGVAFAGPNVQVSRGTSSTVGSTTTPNEFRLNDYGDYTGLAFVGGVAHVAWADNSNSTGTNPDGAGRPTDVYTVALTVATDPTPVAGAPIPTLVAKAAAGRGKAFDFSVVFTDPQNDLNLATLDANDILVTGPNGFTQTAQLRKAKRKGATVTASYRFAPPGGPRAVGRGVYTIGLQPTQVGDLAGNFAGARTFFGTFLV